MNRRSSCFNPLPITNKPNKLIQMPIEENKQIIPHHSQSINNEESLINLLKEDKRISLTNIPNLFSAVTPITIVPIPKQNKQTDMLKQQRTHSFANIIQPNKKNSLMELPKNDKKKKSNFSSFNTQIKPGLPRHHFQKEDNRCIKHIEKICDSSSEDESDLDEIKNSSVLISQNNIYKFIWDYFIIGYVTLITIVIPFIVAFTANTSYIIIIEISNMLIILINIVLNFMTPYIDNDDNVIINQTQITDHYLKNWFIFDVISCFPYSLCVLQEASFTSIPDLYDNHRFERDIPLLQKILMLFPLIQMIEIILKGQLHSLLKIILDFFRINSQIERLLYFLFSFILLNHLVACFWFFTCNLQYFTPNCWVVRLGYIDDNITRLYIESYSWSLATITTIGYGNISAGTTLERIYTLIVMSFGVVMFSFAIGSLSSIVNISDSKTELMNTKLQSLSMIEKEYSIDKETYERIRGSIKYDHNHNDKGNHNTFLHDLPLKLQIELSQCMHDSKIKQMHLFKAYPNKDLFAFLAPMLKPIQFVQRDILYKSNDKIEEMYFISKGTISFCLGQEYNEKEIKSLKRYNNFGEIEMCVGELLGYNIKIKSRTCDLFVLKKGDFLKLSIRFQEIIESFMQKSLMIYLRFKDKMMGMIHKNQLNENQSDCDAMITQEVVSEYNEDDEYVEQLECIDENIEEESLSNSSNNSENNDKSNDYNNTNNDLSNVNEVSLNLSNNKDILHSTGEKTEDNKDIECRTIIFTDNNEDPNISASTFTLIKPNKKQTLKEFKIEVKKLRFKFNQRLSKLISFITVNNIEYGRRDIENKSPLELLKEIQSNDKRLVYCNDLLQQIQLSLSETLPSY